MGTEKSSERADWQTSSGELAGMRLCFLMELVLCECSHYGTKVLLVYGVQYYQDQYPVIFNVFHFLLCQTESTKNVRLRILCCGGVTSFWFGQSFELELPSRPSLLLRSQEKTGRL